MALHIRWTMPEHFWADVSIGIALIGAAVIGRLGSPTAGFIPPLAFSIGVLSELLTNVLPAYTGRPPRGTRHFVRVFVPSDIYGWVVYEASFLTFTALWVRSGVDVPGRQLYRWLVLSWVSAFCVGVVYAEVEKLFSRAGGSEEQERRD